MAKNEVKIPSIESQPIGINIGADSTGISANQAAGITQPPQRLQGGALGSGTTPEGTVSLVINGKTYYLLYSLTA